MMWVTNRLSIYPCAFSQGNNTCGEDCRFSWKSLVDFEYLHTYIHTYIYTYIHTYIAIEHFVYVCVFRVKLGVPASSVPCSWASTWRRASPLWGRWGRSSRGKSKFIWNLIASGFVPIPADMKCSILPKFGGGGGGVIGLIACYVHIRYL